VILLDMLLPGMSGPDVLMALKKDSATAGIPVVAFTGLSQKNAMRLQKDGACAFLEKSTLELDKGCDTLLTAFAEILAEVKVGGSGGSRCAAVVRLLLPVWAREPLASVRWTAEGGWPRTSNLRQHLGVGVGGRQN
jgi:CheY-like chemotaxis protein